MKPHLRSPLPMRDAKSPFFFGVDVGGTSIKIGLVDNFGRSVDLSDIDGENRHRGIVTTKTEPSPQTACSLIARSVHDILSCLKIEHDLCGGIGLGIPGTMDMQTHRLRQPPNLHSWEGYLFVDELSKQSGFPVTFCNDANAAAYGEYWVGSASGQSSMALLTLGTGIGCGIIIEGRSIDGATGYGGECGHLVIDCSDDALLCGCGQRGHLEAYASATGLARRTLKLVSMRKSSLQERISPETRLGEIAKLVYEEGEKGDALALEIISDTAHYLSYGIVSLINTVDPACILLGGAMTFGESETAIGLQFLESVKREVRSKTFKAIADSIIIDFAKLGSSAGYIGAAGLAREAFLTQNR
ncbi:MAG: ROK family protein [Thermoguttaceae bacterium]